MEGTSSTAHVEPKQKSQDPAAKAKRLKRLLANPDFAEAVEFERSLVKKYKQCVSESADVLIEALASSRARQWQRYNLRLGNDTVVAVGCLVFFSAC